MYQSTPQSHVLLAPKYNGSIFVPHIFGADVQAEKLKKTKALARQYFLLPLCTSTSFPY